MKRFARAGVLLATLLGGALAVVMVGSVGIGQIIDSVGSIGWLGMAAFTGWSLLVLVLLGLAWLAVTPGMTLARLPLFVWARTTREAATDVLPFSHLGGFVIGGRTLSARGVPQPLIYASIMADLTTELAAQLLFTTFGVTVLMLVLMRANHSQDVLPMALAGLCAMAGLVGGLAFAQRPMLKIAGSLGAMLLPSSVTAMAAVQERLDAIYREPRRVILAFLANLLAWIASAAGAWIALHFIGSPLPLWSVLTIEALIFTLRSVAFAIPGALGVQETAYALIGPLFGLPPVTALALSLLKRARDLLIGVPAIIVWQWGEYASLASARRRRLEEGGLAGQ